jgi:hypothetical protein
MIRTPDDLRAAIRELGETEPDPARVAEKLLSTLSDEEAHAVAAAALPDYVRRVLATPYMHATGRPAPTFETAGGQRTASPKVAGIIDRLDAELNKSVYVASHDEWKRFGMCCLDDVLTLVANRRRKADEVIAEANRYEHVAEAMREHNADTVADLPRDVLAKVLAR